MEVKLCVGKLSDSTTQEELTTFFAQAGEMTKVEIMKADKSGESKGFAFVSMFNAHLLVDHAFKVNLAKPRRQRGMTSPIYEP